MLALDRLRDFSGAPFDPATTKGTVTRQVQLGMPLRPDLPPGSTEYDIAVDLTNFSADKMLFGQKVEAQTLRVTANNQSYEIKGDVKIAGAPAQIEYRRLKGESDAEVKLRATLDEAARTRFRPRCRPGARRADAGQAHRPRRIGRSRGPLQCRSRSDQHQDRQPAAGLDQGAGTAGAGGLHAGQAEGRAGCVSTIC